MTTYPSDNGYDYVANSKNAPAGKPCGRFAFGGPPRRNCGAWCVIEFIELAGTWSDADMARVAAYRKQKAREEQSVPDKAARRECQKQVKACTLVLDFFEGRKRDTIMPAELHTYVLRAVIRL